MKTELELSGSANVWNPTELPREHSNQVIAIVVILFFSLAVRVLFVLFVPAEPWSDGGWYHAAAQNLVRRGEYGPGHLSAFYPPGYPAFLAVIYTVAGESQLAGKLVDAILGTLVCWLTWLTGKRAFGSRTGLVGAFLMAAWPNQIFHVNLLMSEILSTAMLMAIIVLVMDTTEGREMKTAWIAVGLLCAWASLTRPVMLILLPAITLYRLQKCRTVYPVALVVLFVIIVVSGWTLRNYHAFGKFVPIATNSGINFWIGNNKYATGTDNYSRDIPADDRELIAIKGADELDKSRLGWRFGIEYIRNNPLAVLKLFPLKVFHLYRTDTSGYYQGFLYAPMTPLGPRRASMTEFARLYSVIRLGTISYYVFVLLLASISMLFIRKYGLPSHYFLIVTIILTTLFYGVFFAKVRYHFPLMPIFALFAGHTIMVVKNSLASSNLWRLLHRS